MVPPRLLAVLLAAPLLALPASARQAPDDANVRSGGGARLTLTGGIQARASWGSSDAGERLGFGLRRARFRMNAAHGSGAGAYLQLEGAGGNVSVLDFYAQYQAGGALRFRLGRFASAQPRSLILTSMFQIDVADRAAIAERWASATTGSDGRDFALEMRWKRGATEVLAQLHNGDGNWDRARGNFRPAISGGSATDGGTGTARAFTASIERTVDAGRGLVVGGFAGVNRHRNPNAAVDGVGRTYTTGGVHAYLGAEPGSQPVRVKLDALAIRYEALPGAPDPRLTTGVSLLGAARFGRGVEGFARIESFDSDRNDAVQPDVYPTVGVTVSPSALRGAPFHRERVTLAWQRFDPGADGPDNEDLVFLQLQIAF